MAYQKPVIGALSMDSENCGCNFHVVGGRGFFLYTEGLQPPHGGQVNPGAIAENNVANVGDNYIGVTPLANTGLPGTQPIIIGVPVGVSGVHANVGPSGSNTAASVDTAGLAILLFGQTYDVPLL